MDDHYVKECKSWGLFAIKSGNHENFKIQTVKLRRFFITNQTVEIEPMLAEHQRAFK